jgi:hypothetical protein
MAIGDVLGKFFAVIGREVCYRRGISFETVESHISVIVPSDEESFMVEL